MNFKGTWSARPQDVARKIDKIREVTQKDVFEAVAEGTLLIHAAAITGIMKQSPGKRMTRYNPKRQVVVSKPGDTPNVDRGVFVKSVQFNADRNKGTGEVGSNDKRAPWFEFGTTAMAARPWLWPAWLKAKPAVMRLFKTIKVKVPTSA